MCDVGAKKVFARESWALRGVVTFSLFVFSFFVGVRSVFAASYFLSPSAGTYHVGQTITVGIYVSSADQSMNASSVKLAFPPSLLSVSGISKSGSVINLWAQEPSYSNDVGTATLEGIILNPGFTGSSGKIGSVSFKVLSEGSATVQFLSTSILANDGLGTEISRGGSGAAFIITPQEQTTKNSEPEAAHPSSPPPAGTSSGTTPSSVEETPSSQEDIQTDQPSQEIETSPTIMVPVSYRFLSAFLQPYFLILFGLLTILILLFIWKEWQYVHYRHLVELAIHERYFKRSASVLRRAYGLLQRDAKKHAQKITSSTERENALEELDELAREIGGGFDSARRELIRSAARAKPEKIRKERP